MGREPGKRKEEKVKTKTQRNGYRITANLKPKMDPWKPVQKKLLLYINHHEKGM